jgi:soluble lytic murein transglycosylase-like protein
VAEYFASIYARHYHVPVPLVRAIIQRESNWQACAVSPKGAKGLMQLMPATARCLGVRDSCNIEQNVSGGVRYLAWLMRLFHNDLRLVAAGYYAGEDIVARRGLSYHNRDVVSYVAKIRATYVLEAGVADDLEKPTSKRVMR